MKFLRVILLCMTTAAASAAFSQTAVSHSSFGKLPDGSGVELYTLKSDTLQLQLITFGARVVSLTAPDRSGKSADIVLGYDNLEDYVHNKEFFFGVVPGRYANRIAHGKFMLEGKTYQLTLNDGPNTLHGGVQGFGARNWSAKEIPNGVEFTLVSPDGDQGFPGMLTAHVRYILQHSTVRIEYSATTDKATVVNLTNHAYFNLAGEGNPSILGEKLMIDADKYTPVDSTLIPNGQLAPVAGTPFDFTHATTIGDRINDANEQLKFAGGYDHNWVLRGTAGTLHPAAKVYDPASGRVLTVETTEPGVQFYAGNFLDGSVKGSSGRPYVKRSALCLETQHFPDSPNQPSFPSTELKPGSVYHSVTTWTFSVEK
jgi:aldose 1-epimerase